MRRESINYELDRTEGKKRKHEKEDQTRLKQTVSTWEFRCLGMHCHINIISGKRDVGEGYL
jgi:hypothetical protein